MKKPVQLEKENYTIQVNYSDEAIEKKLMKFIAKPSGDSFEISAEEMSSILMGQVNSELLAATFVDVEKVNVVEVSRQIDVRVDRDIKAGEIVKFEYRHPYPAEFAILEEAMKIAKINKNAPVYELTEEFLAEVVKKIKPEQEKFIKKFWDFIKIRK